MMMVGVRKDCNNFHYPQGMEKNDQEYTQIVSVPNPWTLVLIKITATFIIAGRCYSYIFIQNSQEGHGLEAEINGYCPHPSHRTITFSRQEAS